MFPWMVSRWVFSTRSRPKSLMKEVNAMVPPITEVSYPTRRLSASLLDCIPRHGRTGEGGHGSHRGNQVDSPVPHLRRIIGARRMSIPAHSIEKNKKSNSRSLKIVISKLSDNASRRKCLYLSLLC